MDAKEEFEIKKLSLNNTELIADVKANPVVKATILSVLTVVPIIGNLIDVTIDATLSAFQEKNAKNYLILSYRMEKELRIQW